MGSSNAPHVMTLVNSIIGVSILAMPFCYKQCGILLASLILIFTNLMTRLSCHYLLKSAIMTRRRTFELLAFHALGTSGKTAVELSIILLMIGTCIAFFVVMGDLGPAIIGSLLQINHSSSLRPTVLIALAIFVVLPLGLLRNIDSLSTICTMSFLFYLLLVFKVFIESTKNLFAGSWIEEIHYWRPSGILQCLPIFSMALSCQTQLLEIFDSLRNGTLDGMSSIVKSAVNLCTALYIGVGFFGYVAYYKQTFSGNLLMSFSESYISEFIKLGFVLSVAVTFPMVIFPCRTSLYSMLFRKVNSPQYELVTGGGNYIPENQFKCITLFIITCSLIVGLLAPNIEVVLGLLGSTIGVIVCVLCPPFMFIWISSKATTEKVLAQMLCACGVFIMIMGTYANLYLSETTLNVDQPLWKNEDSNAANLAIQPQLNPIVQQIPQPNEKKSIRHDDVAHQPKNLDPKNERVVEDKIEELPKQQEKRVEPPEPIAPEIRKEPPVAVPQLQNQENVKQQAMGIPNQNEKQDEPNESQSVPKKTFPKVKSGQKKLLRDQQAVIKKMRERNKNDAVMNAPGEMPPKVDAPVEVKSNELKLIGENRKNDETDAKLAPGKGLKISPLPVLLNPNPNEEKPDAKDTKREILENVPANEGREKRDLYEDNKAILKSDNNIDGVKLKKTITNTDFDGHEDESGFVKNVAREVDDEAACKKEDTKIALAFKNDSKNEAEMKIKQNNGAPSGTTNQVKSVETTTDNMRKLLENVETEKQTIVNSFSVIEKEKKIKKDHIIIVPQKLSIPSETLPENIPMDDDKRSNAVNMLKTLDKRGNDKKK